MQTTPRGRLYSASDVVNFAACPHLTHLDLVNLETPLPKAEDSDEMILIQDKGIAHESRYWKHLQAAHPDAVDVTMQGRSTEEQFHATTETLAAGASIVYQATLLDAPWIGHADFLVRVERPSSLGPFSYEVVDTKLARSSRAKFLIQLCLYSELLAEVQGAMPEHMHVVLGDGKKESFLVADYLRYFRRLKQRFLKWVQLGERDSYPERVGRCDSCRWREICSQQWEEDDHLNRVADIRKTQIVKLRAAGIDTLEKLAELSPMTQVPGIQPDTLQRLTQQARLQRDSRQTGEAVYELLPPVEGKGFTRMPAPAEGDLFFDMEGDPMEVGGLEYLFGLYYLNDDQPIFKPFWAHNRQQERLAFEAFVDFVIAHLRDFPRAHIYHYAPYEVTALKRLMSLHGTRESEIDHLLRTNKLVDLYAVVRDAIRIGEPSYSIKALERFYSSQKRSGDVTTAGASIVYYEKWKATKDETILKAIEDYNLDDVRSTYELRNWLLSLRPESDKVSAQPAADSPTPEQVPSPAAVEAAELLETYRAHLLDGLPDDRLNWTNEDRLRELLFHLLSFHRRTAKPVWWAMFDRQTATQEELLEDLDAIAGLTELTAPIAVARSHRFSFQYPEQETKLKTGDSCSLTFNLESLRNVVIDDEARHISFLRSNARIKAAPFPDGPLAIGTGQPLNTAVIVGAIQRFVDAYLKRDDKFRAGLALLRRVFPNVVGCNPGDPLARPDESLLEASIRTVTNLDHSYLFIQGPPGAGKTYTGSHVIAELIKNGRKIAVTSNSHKAINNLLAGVEKVAIARATTFRGVKKSSSVDQEFSGQLVENCEDNQDIIAGIDDYQLVAGTAWLFSKAEFEQKFDYLFVDEAGQVALANLVAMSTCARNIVLLGDQMQLGQPIQGVHPGESGLSSLDYLLQGEATIDKALGIFLSKTWRMHPDVCRFISEAVYTGRLEPEQANERQRLLLNQGAHSAIKPTGISFIPVLHDACAQKSEEEAKVVCELYASLLLSRFVDRDGNDHPMTAANILVVAPYNLQVQLIKQLLPEGARVGTVDKFQGQEAEAVLVSMTTSSGEYLPRNIEFLYSKNRLNVAISRARCWSGVVVSPALLDVAVSSPEQMRLVNLLCWVEEFSHPALPPAIQ